MIEGQEGLTWDRWRRIADAVERSGFESLWRSDHLFSLFGVADRPGLDCWPSLTYLATATRRIRFGPLVCPITFRHPAMTAREAAAVDVLSGGRLDLGLGAGWHDGEHHAFGGSARRSRSSARCGPAVRPASREGTTGWTAGPRGRSRSSARGSR